LDYKDFDEDVNFSDSGQDGLKTPIKYLPLLFSYSATRSDATGKTQFSLGLNMAIRNLVTNQREFEIKRYKARGDYLYVTAGVERTQKLPLGMSLFAKLDGQIASQPLISNEQYIAGGMESVRGYQESELSGDHALHGTLELNLPELSGLLGLEDKFKGTPYLFCDIAELWTSDPLPGEEKYKGLQGVGAGIRGEALEKIEYGIDGSIALKDTDYVSKGHYFFYFKMKYEF
jgi:hemolysin activation/secretion protein